MRTIFVIFGSTGDLAKRKLFPALFDLCSDQQSASDLDILCLGRRDFDSVAYREYMRKETHGFLRKKDGFDAFLEKVEYLRLNLEDLDDYLALEEALRARKDADTQILFYLAISPEQFPNFIDNCKHIDRTNLKVIFEKPFGTDLGSARVLNEKISEVFEEPDIYRIDHYVGKESIQNILAFRFANTIYEAIWNNKYIDNIQISACEDMGVGSRGGYYDRFGALRDMFQNHLLQVLALVTMDCPSRLDATSIIGEKLKILRSIDLGEDFNRNIVFGQYDGYLQEKGVAPDSRTETFVAIKLNISTWNFDGVPIYLMTGKALSRKTTTIIIEFKEVPEFLSSQYGGLEKNRIVIEVQPNESIDIHFNIKQGGKGNELQKVESVFHKHLTSKDAYEKLIMDAIAGDKSLFTSWDMLEESWKIVDELVHCTTNCPILHIYEQGVPGESIASGLLEADGRKWYE